MNQQLTLVATVPTDSETLKNALSAHLNIFAINRREAHVFDVICDAETALSPTLRETLYAMQCDFALQTVERAAKKLFISDMDATMVIGETIDDMAETLGMGEQISAITARAMRGEIPFEVALRERLGLMKGIAQTSLIAMANNVRLTEGAATLLATINARGLDSCLISGGFTAFTQLVSAKLGFKRHKANQLGYDADNKLNGTWVGELVDAEVKVATLKQLAAENDITLAETVAVGDGANDRLMIEAAGLGVAYYGKPLLREVANAEIHCGTMANLVYFL